MHVRYVLRIVVLVVENHSSLPWWFWRAPLSPNKSKEWTALGSSSLAERAMAAQSQWLRRRAVASRRESRELAPRSRESGVSHRISQLKAHRTANFCSCFLLASYWPVFFWPMTVLSLGFRWFPQCVCVFFWMVVYVRLPGHHLPIVRSCVDQLINPNEYQGIPVLGLVLDAAKWFTYAYLPLDQWGKWWYVSGMCSYNVLSCFYIHVISMFNMIWNLVVGTYWSLQSTMIIWIMYIIVHLQSIIYIYIL